MFQPKTRKLIRRIRMKLFNHRKQTIILITIAIWLFYIFYQIFSQTPSIDHHSYDSQLEHFTNISKCQRMNPLANKVLETFIHRIITTLEMFEVTHFLCYDTLWAALRRATRDDKNRFDLKLSDSCFNLCVLNEDIIKHDESIIERRFRNNGITFQYIHSDGIYILKPTTRLIESKHISSVGTDEEALHPLLFSIHARIHVFEKFQEQDMFRRIGWRSRILPPTMCKQLHCFPSNLIHDSKTLPKIEFLPSLHINVPREGFEIQKYHYPDNWWTLTDPNDEECA